MKYMLVLQLPDTFYDNIEALENAFIKELKGIAEIDGHDIGVNELNFFILTDDVNHAFNKIKPLLKGNAEKLLKAAYRELGSEQYHIIYPDDLAVFRIS